MFSNLQSLNQSQTALAKRLIERMSSLIIDKECIETLIELVEYKVKQRLTPKQRKLLSTAKKSSSKQQSKTKSSKKGRRRKVTASSDEDDDDDEYDQDEDDANGEFDIDDDDGVDDEDDLSLPNEQDSDSEATKTTSGVGDQNDLKTLLRHIDDDGEKGIRLLNVVLGVHATYGFTNASTYKSLISFVNSSKENIVSSTLRLLAHHFSFNSVKNGSTGGETGTLSEFSKVNDAYVNKIKSFCKSGKPKQAKFAVFMLFNCFEPGKNEEILTDLYKVIHMVPLMFYHISLNVLNNKGASCRTRTKAGENVHRMLN